VSQDDGTSPLVPDESDATAERFFAEGDAAAENVESLAPTTSDEEDWDLPAPPPPTPEQLRRRARLRRIVALGLGGGVALLLTGIGAARLATASRARARQAATSVATSAVESRGAREPAVPRVGSSAPPAASVGVEDEPATKPEPSASAPPLVVQAKAASVLKLVTTARALLQAGRAREGIDVARQAIEADATLPEAYVLLAAGLEDLGLWRDAHRVFATCADRTKSGECSYFARKPR
jgi:hypothetical protein